MKFNEAHEITEVWETDGFKDIWRKLNNAIDQCDAEIRRLQNDIVIKNGDLNAEQIVQKIIYTTGNKEGLLFLQRAINKARQVKGVDKK